MNETHTVNAELMCVKGLYKDYVQQRLFSRASFVVRALDDVNLSIHQGRTLAVIGESGAGKSTLARCLALLEIPTHGEILFEGKSLLGLRRRDLFPLRRKIQVIFQDPTSSLNPRMTATEIVCEPLAIHRMGGRLEQRERSLQLMMQVGLPAGCERRRPFELSGGQRQRLAIARALALEPRLLILDEALSNLDRMNQELILQLLLRLQSTLSLAYVHVSHDLRLISRCAHEVAVMCNGRIVERQPANRLFAHPENSHTRGLLAAMPTIESIYARRFAEESRWGM
jgi:ABC-type glutathione transport system ATPase component